MTGHTSVTLCRSTIIALLFLCTSLPCVYCHSPIVDLGYVLHQGFEQTTLDGLQYYNFSNIRYAAPPIGQGRFQAPTAPVVNRTVVQTGRQEAICPQATASWLYPASDVVASLPLTYTSVPPFGPSNLTGFDPRQTEDCLFLDVLVPKQIFDTKNLSNSAAVLFSISASANTDASKTWYGGGAGLLSRSTRSGSPGVIYVAPNYRVGLFGFLAGEEALRNGEPNAGLLDQRFAMLWVQKNIHLFGGDPENVTIIGKSSGAGDILAHVVAYGNKQGYGLFKRAISQSPFLQYISPATAEATYRTVLNYSGVSTYAELKNLSTLELQRTDALIVGQASPYGTFVFGITTDDCILPDDPPNLLLQGLYDKSIQMFTGLASDEGLLLTSPFIKTNTQFEAYLKDLLPSASVSALSYISNVLYPANFSGAYGYTTQMGRLDHAIGDYCIVCPNVYLQNAYPANSTYQYEFTVPPGAHAQDLGYTYYYEGASENPNVPTAPPVNTTLAEIMQAYFTAFAEKGNPNVPGLPFFPLDAGETVQNFNDSYVGAMERRFVSERRCNWWQRGYYREGVRYGNVSVPR